MAEAVGGGGRSTMTDEEAREDIRTGHGLKADWLVRNLLAVYERYRQKGLEVREALEQARLCYLASIGAAGFNMETGLYQSRQL